RIEPLIKDILEEHLDNQTYEPNFCRLAAIKITNQLKERMKRLRYPRYKYVCHAMLGEINNQDVRAVSRCAWDTCVDSFAQYEYRNCSLYGIGLVYAIYFE
ncbi:predicted protein, partial [Nematostella vectensis]